jgi:hypothetical protein
MRTMTLGAMLLIRDGQTASAAAQVRCDARAIVQDLDDRRCGANLHQLMHQVIGHTVEIGIEADVVIDVDASARPLAQIERLGRERLQGRFIDGCEHRRAASIALAEWAVVQLGEQFADGRVQLFQSEELVVTQRRHDPALGDLHGVFDFGFAGSHRVQLVWEPRQADSASPIPFIRFVGPSTNW